MNMLGSAFIAFAVIGWWLSRGESKVFGGLGYTLSALMVVAGVVCCLVQYGLLK